MTMKQAERGPPVPARPLSARTRSPSGLHPRSVARVADYGCALQRLGTGASFARWRARPRSYFLPPRAVLPSPLTVASGTCFLGGWFPLVFALVFSGS